MAPVKGRSWLESVSFNPSQAGFYLVAIWLQPGRMPPVEKEEFELSPIQIPYPQQVPSWLVVTYSWGLYLDACGRGRSIGTVLWLLTPVKGRNWLGLWIPIHLFSSQVRGRGRPNGTVLRLLTPVKGRSWLGYESQSTCSFHRCFPATDIMDHLRREEVDWVIPDAGDGASGGKAKIFLCLSSLLLHLDGLCGWTLRSMECC